MSLGGSISIKLVAQLSTYALNANSFQSFSLNPLDLVHGFTYGGLGQTTSTSLTNLKYYIMIVQVCKNVTLNGTATSASGCMNIYSVDGPASYEQNGVIEAMAHRKWNLYDV